MYSEVDPRAVALLEESISAFLPDNYAVAADPSFKIGPRNPFKGMPSEVLKEQMEFDYRPEDLQKYYDKINRPGPKLPLAYLRDDPALTPMGIAERDFIEYQKNRPIPGTVVDPQKLDLQEYLNDDSTRYTGEGAPYEPIERYKFLMGPGSPLASAVQPEYYENPRTGLLMATIPSGPNTPLPTPGWNPSMIKSPGNPNFRPTPTYDRIGPNGERIPYGPLV